MRILVAGTGNLGAAILEPLLESRHHVVGVLLNGKRVKGTFRRYRETSALFGTLDVPVRLAKRWGLPLLWLDPASKHTLAPIAALKPDLLITCGFGIILKEPLLSLPAVGCVNVHSSLLPKHRGPMPFNWAILSGDSQTGVTFHVTTPAIDSGDILDQRSIPVTENDTALSVYRRCCELARQRVTAVADLIETNGLHGTPQNEDEATYDPPLTSTELTIDWTRTADEVDRTVRAGTPNLPARFMYRGRVIEVERTRRLDAPTDARPGTVLGTEPHVVVATGMGAIALVRANTIRPIAWPWPGGLTKPKTGTVLE